MSSVEYAPVETAEIPAAHAIEIAGFPTDEAASLEAFQSRQRQAPDLFLGAYISTDHNPHFLIGYICSTLSPAESLTHESMSTHIPGSSSVCIHSICVSAEHRRKGVALGLLKEYLVRLQKASEHGAPYKRVLLISHEELLGLYVKAGFETIGESAVVHGSRPWFEMRKVLQTVAPSLEIAAQSTQQLPPGLWEALERASTSRSRPVVRLLSSFPSGVQDVTSDGTLNQHDLLCPREGCGSIILKAKVALLEERPSAELEPQGRENLQLAPLPRPPATTHWWKVTPNAMVFENIGFSRSVGSQVPIPNGSSKGIKLLLCAECDLGPLGWCEEGGSEFWLAASRVGYRQ
ncbi:acyl-CoA N-acyltransferase [Cristinia sonorae]|uniref:Acyl-CoA N-acyltransferase n=1 Tax=Cristinia sonorae TaxID=1940300 RepID=A0A8K0UU93_9AGAR|nr:acyl-CoA N-acyltransferase [Cristinia sonorae]